MINTLRVTFDSKFKNILIVGSFCFAQGQKLAPIFIGLPEEEFKFALAAHRYIFKTVVLAAIKAAEGG